MNAPLTSARNGSGASLAAEGKHERKEPEPSGRAQSDRDPVGCENDFEIEGKTRREAAIVANRILLRGRAKPREVERIVSAVNACDLSPDSAFSRRDGTLIPLSEGALSGFESALFCEKCLSQKYPKKFTVHLNGKASRSR